MGVKTYFLSILFLFSVIVTLENVTNAADEPVESVESVETLEVVEVITSPPTPEPKKRTKLTAKQVLMLNQLIGAYSLDGAKDPLCKNHTLKFKEAMRSFESWAIKMVDASSKLQAGLLVGNTGDFGAFEECLKIFTDSEYGPIKGQMCTLKIIPGDSLTRYILNISNLPLSSFDKIISTLKFDTLWSVCLPDSCPPSDVERHFNRTLASITEGLEVSLELPENGCISSKTISKPLTKAQWIAIIFLGTIIIFVIICTIYDIVMHVRKEKHINEVLQIFSAYKNSQIIFADNSDSGGKELDCLNGIRSLSMCWVLLGHRYLITMFVPVVNGLDIIKWTQKPISTTVTGGTVSVDSFFMVSGLLVSYLFLAAMNKGVHFNLPLFYLHRYMRVTPVLGVVILIYATLVNLMGSGPVWERTAKGLKEPCIRYWWSCLLHIQNYVNAADMCVVQTWYLTCDMQYYFFSPVILYPLWKWPHLGWFLWVATSALAIGTNFYLGWKYELNAGMPISNELLTTKYFTDHYTTPYTRAAPYLVGIALGNLLYHTREKKIHMNTAFAVLGWTASFLTLTTITIGALTFQLLEHPYNKLESSLYMSLARPAWAISLAWIVFNCINGTGGIMNAFLSAYPFKVIAKLSYCMFLTHMIIMFTLVGAEKTTYYFSDLQMWYMTFGDFALTFIASYFLAVCVEFPIIRLDGVLRKRGKKLG